MKKIIWILVIVIITIFISVIWFFNNMLGNNKYDLKGISEVQKQEVIALLNCVEIADDIELIEMQIPKAYKDISYEIYIKTDNQNIKDYVLKKETDLYGIDFKELNKNNYRCVVYRKDDKSIDLLEAIVDGKEINDFKNIQDNKLNKVNNTPKDVTEKILNNNGVHAGIINNIDEKYIYYSDSNSRKFYFEKNAFSYMNGRTCKSMDLSDVKVGDYIHAFEKQIIVYRNLSGEELNQELLYNLTLTEDERTYIVNSIGIEEINITNENTAIVRISYGDIIGDYLTNDEFSTLVEFNSNTKYYSNVNNVNDLEIAKGNINTILLKKDSINKKSPAIVLEFESTDT